MTGCAGEQKVLADGVGCLCRPRRARLGVPVAVLALLLLGVRLGMAQEIGTVAELEGTADVGRAGVWTPASIGAAIQPGDTLRTGSPGRLAVVFQDDSVVTVGDDSELVVDEQIFERDAGIARSVMHLLWGRIRALVSEYYERRGTEFRIETVTAVTGVRGTEFVIVFDPVAEVTDAVGVSGRAEVHSVLDRVKHAVFITAQEITTVTRGKYPTPARRLDDDSFGQYVHGLAFVGHGKPESLAAVQPLLTGSIVPPPDRLANLPAPPIPVGQPVATGVTPTSPGETATDRVNSQNAGGVAQQPPAVLESPQGRLGIHF